MPRLLDHRLELEALDQHTGLVVHLEIHRSDHPCSPSLLQPSGGRVQQCPDDLLVVLELEEPEHSPAARVVLAEGVVDLRRDSPHGATVTAREEVLPLGVLEVRIQPAIQKLVALDLERGDPRGPRVQSKRQRDELAQVPKATYGRDLDRGPGGGCFDGHAAGR